LQCFRGRGRTILDKFKIDLPVGDVPTLDQVISQFQNFASEIQNHIDYFNQYSDPSPSEDRSTINTMLEAVKTYTQSIIDKVNNRCDGIPALMGNTSSGLNKMGNPPALPGNSKSLSFAGVLKVFKFMKYWMM
jgi:hypothetical protein